ncbi:MAG: hypothetical protein ACRDYE_16025, partial [Acidimicrobiales bacterium]
MIKVFGSVGGWLDERFFRDSPRGPRTTPLRLAVIAAVAALMMVIQIVRVWSSAPLNSIWAEDGYIFLADALRWGFFHALITPYSGYLNTVSRLVAEPVSFLPIGWFAPAMALSGAAILTWCAFVVWYASAGYIRSAYLRGVMVVVMVVSPLVGIEMLDNVTYSIWYLLFASFWVLLWRPSTLAGAAGAGALILLTTLSNALIILFLPLWLLRVFAMRDVRDKIIAGSFAVGVAVQYAFSWNQRGLIGERGGYQIPQASQWHWSLVPAYVQRIVGGVVTGQRISSYLWLHLGIWFELVLAAAFIIFVVTVFVGTDVRTR